MPSLVDYLCWDIPFAFLVSQVHSIIVIEGVRLPYALIHFFYLFCPAFFPSLLHIGVVDDLVRYRG